LFKDVISERRRVSSSAKSLKKSQVSNKLTIINTNNNTQVMSANLNVPSLFDVKGKIALVTGGGTGIGKS
jgi:hypothetical protein